MPSIEDWTTQPYAIIQKIYEECGNSKHEDFVQKVQDYFNERLSHTSLTKIPSLNSVPLDQLKSGTLVKYRCMIQDVFDPQFCIGQYKVTNTTTHESRIECGSFRDVPNVAPNETVDYAENNHIERLGFYCVPIPGESEWVKTADSCNVDMVASSSTSSGQYKRQREMDNDESSESSSDQNSAKELKDNSKDVEMCSPSASSFVQTALHKEVNSNTKIGFDMNFPLSTEKGLPCIIRVYSNEPELRTTDAVEFVGILSVDPQLASIFDDEMEAEDVACQQELKAHEPPPSLVPRMHALVIRKLHHNNPYLPPVPSEELYKTAVKSLMEDAASIHFELLSILQHALLNDRLAAEYLLCHLISSVYARADVLPLGKLCINLSGCPVTQKYTKFLHHLISQITPQSVILDMSIENMNSLRLIPQKNYQVNRITAGMLQLTPGTHLVLDETELRQGQLNHTGVTNVKALADVINWQKVDYDFQWHPIPVHTNINILTLSEGESLLPKDIHVPLVPDQLITDIPSHFSKLDHRMTPDNLNKLRSYITACRLCEYQVPEEMQVIIQDDFVNTRQDNPKNMTIEDFQRFLGLIRVLVLTYGKGLSNIEMWNKVKTMEEERKSRLVQQQASRDQN
uniref:Mini-chromosome maintenance complex-binding protein n=1 Tax=Biomphalaria glabrata TaxID=6526 RepID=A0A2C9L921_BIOGL